MSRPDQGDWVSLRGRTRVNSAEGSTPIERQGTSEGITINDLNQSSVLESRWLIRYNEYDKVPISRRMETITTYDSARGISIGDM